MKKVETAVLSRIHSIEFPFFGGFLAHYLNRLGFDRVIFIQGENADPAPLRAQIEWLGFGDRVDILLPARFDDAEALFDGLMPNLAERCEWLLLADLDEYVYLGDRSIKDLLASHKGQYRVVHFRSIMVASAQEAPTGYADVVAQASMFPKWMTKTVFQTAGVKTMTAHIPIGIKPIPPKKEFIHEIVTPIAISPFEFHFCSRGLRDLVLRSIRQNFPTANVKATDMEALKRFLVRRGDVKTLGEVPGRFAVLMVQLMEDVSARPRIALTGRIAADMLGDIHFDMAMLDRMLAAALDSIGLPADTKRRIFEGRLLSNCVEQVIDRFWKDNVRAHLDSLNYVKIIKKMQGRPY
ncbi:MAG: hypothetical protein WD044_07385 [Dongiaceae bacterium]